ncbi:arginase [Aestuariibius insulae]|uniref:arginase n=1 Tax=Aestuariibius insulae TaxID=2058287 RepID=UPI00345E613C
MTPQICILVGIPMDSGKRRQGCRMGPDALRIAGLAETLQELGHTVEDRGTVTPDPAALADTPPLYALAETVGWTQAITRAAQDAAIAGMPIFLGGDHALSLGTLAGLAAHAKQQNRPLFVLWLDAHADFHTPNTTQSGNLHGTPVAYAAGRDGFNDFPPFPATIPGERIAMIGLRSVDPEEKAALDGTGIHLTDMRALDERGLRTPLAAFLTRVEQANGLLHVSFDTDFLDPDIAPAVGTTVPGGATLREAHLAMEMLCDSGLVTSLDLVELNPFLDHAGKTAQLLVDLTASLMGRRIFDRPTRGPK